MKIPTRVLEERQSGASPSPSTSTSGSPSSSSPPGSSAQAAVFAGITVGLILLVAFIFFFLWVKRLRATNAEPTYLPGGYLKSKWKAWKPRSTYATVGKPSDPPLMAGQTAQTSTSVAASATNDVDRRQSVRSVITLPSYHLKPDADEQLIAREGERAGIDMVVELPESEEMTEERRESEMTALYNIRQARRREAVQREARRLERQEARQRGDWDRLRIMEEESRARARLRAQSEALLLRATTGTAATNAAIGARVEDLDLTGLTPNDSAYLIAELAAQREGSARARAVSSVSYADLGLAWHDGSRIRADSVDSDRPLLASAASMANSRAASRASSVSGQGGIAGPVGTMALLDHHTHRRLDSNFSNLSTDSAAMHTPQTSSAPDTRNGSRSGFHLTPSSSHELALEPPSYDDDVSVHGGDAPPYESPVREQGSGVSGITTASEAFGADFAPTATATTAQSSTEPTTTVASTSILPTSGKIPEGDRSVSSSSPQNLEDTTTPSASSSPQAQSISPRRNISSSEPLQGLPSLTLSTVPQPPAIEILSATPISSTPPTPITARERWGNLR